MTGAIEPMCTNLIPRRQQSIACIELMPTEDEPQNKRRKSPWTESNDRALFNLVMQQGPKQWMNIAESLSKATGQSYSGKACRERWNNYLDPELNRGPWTVQEETYLVEKVVEFGNKWSSISKQMPGRNENSVRNHYNSILKRLKP